MSLRQVVIIALTFDKTLQDELLVLLGVRLADHREQVAARERARRGRGGGHVRPEGQRPLVVVLHRRRRDCRRDCRRIGQSARAADRSARLFREEWLPAAGAARTRVRARHRPPRAARRRHAAAAARSLRLAPPRAAPPELEEEGTLRAYTEGSVGFSAHT